MARKAGYRRDGNPTRATIRALCAEIRAGWSEATEANRRVVVAPDDLALFAEPPAETLCERDLPLDCPLDDLTGYPFRSVSLLDDV